jgi:hypothetical protein
MGRRTIQNSAVTTEAKQSGSSAPVKFSGATHQTEKAALSSGRTVKMSGHATIGTCLSQSAIATPRCANASSLSPC